MFKSNKWKIGQMKWSDLGCFRGRRGHPSYKLGKVKQFRNSYFYLRMINSFKNLCKTARRLHYIIKKDKIKVTNVRIYFGPYKTIFHFSAGNVLTKKYIKFALFLYWRRKVYKYHKYFFTKIWSFRYIKHIV